MNPLVEVMGDAIRQCDWSRTARRAERERAGWLALLVVLIALAGTALFGRLLSAPGLTLIGGIAIALFGLLFTLQGVGAVGGSPMSNTTTWSVLGPIIALVGIVVAVVGWRRRP